MATTIQTQVAKYTVGLFGAAPGGYMNGLAAHFMGNGTEASFVSTLVNSVEYRTYVANWPAMTAAAQAATIVSTLLGETSGTVYDAGVQAVQGLISGGASYAQAAYAAVDFLANAGSDATYGAYAADFSARIANAIDYSTSAAGSTQMALAELQAQASTAVNLTNATDVRTANVFNAGLVYVPGGNDRINSLQDEDTLTGSGTNPTLNATMGNANDNGGIIITPTLKKIEVLNLEFTGTVNQLDLQDASGISDAININRISDNAANTTTIDNITSIPVDLSLKNSGQEQQTVTFGFTNTAAKGAADSIKMAISNVNVAALTIQEAGPTAATAHDTVLDQGIETINLSSSGSSNTITLLNAEDLKTLNITGDQALTIGGQGNMAGSLSTVDASALTGNLTFTLTNGIMTTTPDGMTTGNVALTFKSGTGTDSVRVSEQIGTNDTFDLGAGTDTLRFQSAGVAAIDFIALNTAGNNVSNVENAQVWKTGAAINAVLALRADEMTGDQAIELRDHTNNAASTTQYNIVNLSAAEATSISIAHSGATTLANPLAASNSLVNNLVELDVDAGVTAVNLTLKDGVNSDARFNFQLYTDSDRALGTTAATASAYATAQDAGTTNAVTDLTITDSDGESNTIDLQADGYNSNVAQGDGTAYTKVTLKGGTAGQFLNLDTSGATGTTNMYGYVTTGAAVGDLTGATNVGVTATRLSAATIDASTFAGDAIVRVGSNFNDTNGAQSITMGTGNDTVIFDNQTTVASNAGLSIADTVKGGTGTDVLAFEGNQVVTLGSSEWTNVSGFETIRLLGNGIASNNAANATNSYNLTLTDALVDNNASDGARINIVNDSDTANDTANTADTAGTGVERGVTINAVALAATNTFAYNGEEGATRTADRFIFADAGINGSTVIDGGAISNVSTAPVAFTVANGNADVMEVRNAAQVDLGDLVGIKNVGAISFTSVGSTTTQVSRLQLTDTIVDAMVNSYQTSTSRASVAPVVGNVEVLNINAVDNMTNAAYTVGLTVEGSTLTDKSDLNIVLGRGANNVQTGGGNDVVTLLGNYAAGTYTAAEAITGTTTGTQTFDVNTQANGTAGARAVTDVIAFNAGTNTLVTYGAINLVGATLSVSGTGTLNLIANSAVVLTDTQYAALGTIRFVGNTTHQLTVTDASGAAVSVDLSKITLVNGSLVIDTTTNTTTNTATDSSSTGGITTGTVGTNPTNNTVNTTITVAAGGTYTGTSGVNDEFNSTIANMSGTTLTGTAADTEALRLTDAGTINVNNGTTGGLAVSNIDTLILASGTNTISFTGTSGVKNITGDSGADAITVTNMTTGGAISLGAGNDALAAMTVAIATASGATFAGGSDTDSVTFSDGETITAATLAGFSGFESVVFGAIGATSAVTLVSGITSINANLATDARNLTVTGTGAQLSALTTITNGDNDGASTLNLTASDVGATIDISGDTLSSDVDVITFQATGSNVLKTDATNLAKIAATAVAAGTTDTLELTATATVANTTFNAFETLQATSGSTAIDITDSAVALARTIIGNAANNTITLGVPTAAKSVNISSGGTDTISVSDKGTAATTITGFTAGTSGDVLNLGIAADNSALTVTMGSSGVVATGATLTGAATDPSAGLALSGSSFQVSGALTQVGDGGAVEAAIMAAALISANTANNKSIVVLDNGTDTGVYLLTRAADAGGTATVLDNASDFSVVLVATLVGVADAGTLVAANIV